MLYFCCLVVSAVAMIYQWLYHRNWCTDRNFIREMPNTMNYVRELYQMPGVLCTDAVCRKLAAQSREHSSRPFRCIMSVGCHSPACVAAGINEAINITHIKEHYFTSHQRLVRQQWVYCTTKQYLRCLL
jgi:glutathionyl-hydroquinone reductase